MWSLSPAVLIAVLGGVIAVSLASGATGYKLGRASGDKDVRAMLEAGQKALADRDRKIATNLELYREDIAAVSARKPKRVFFCPPGRVPEAASGVAGAGAAGVDQHNYEPDLRAARDALIRCNALIGVVK
jgi:hypothetical protein